MTNFAIGNSARVGQNFSVSNRVISDGWMPTSNADSTIIYPVPSQDFIYNFAFQNPNVTAWAVTFDTEKGSSSTLSTATNVRYQVWYNASNVVNRATADPIGRQLVSVVRTMDEAILTALNGNQPQANFDYQLKDWPLVPLTYVSDTVVDYLGPSFYFSIG
ncbi:hypothetical protein HDU76_012031, partial [Blyttiomyces sp. JEL0837]